MLNIHIVTDSSAHFAQARFGRDNLVTVVPNKLEIGGKLIAEGVDLSHEDAIRHMHGLRIPPALHAPSVADYVQVYNRVARHADAVISIHPSREITASWANARKAAQQVSAHNRIAVIDSQSICAGQGMLVQTALEAARTEATFDDLVRLVRGVVDRVYSVYYIETIDFLLHNKLISPSHGILGAILGIKPFVAIENGQLTVIEKVRTRAQAVERLVEFVVEFTDITDILLLQSRGDMTEQTRLLQDRLAADYAGRTFPFEVYNASLAALIGTDATGVVILEEDMGRFEDDLSED